MAWTRRGVLASFAVAALTARETYATPEGIDACHRLWFAAPGKNPIEALLVGNGRLGAMIAGQPRDEVIVLNEDSLWAGQPHAVVNSEAKSVLPQVREAIFRGDYAEADRLCQKMQGPYTHSYAPLADLHLRFDHPGEIASYRRALDLDAAVATVTYRVGATTFRREVFASHPEQVIVLRLTAEGPDALALTLGLGSKLRAKADLQNGRIVLQGKAPTVCEPSYRSVPEPVIYSDEPGKGMFFAAVADVDVFGGRIESENGALKISGTKEVVIRIAAATGFRGPDKAPDTPADAVLVKAMAAIDSAKAKCFAALKRDHVADHQKLYRRMVLSLGKNPALPDATDVRLRANADKPDPSLAALYFNFGRYLLIASSRPGTQAANLQGIWSWEVRPPWSANYTTNINVQENYWAAETCNLAELHQPLFALIEGLARTGAETAKTFYGLGGWCVHHNADIWCLSSPVGQGEGTPTWANWGIAAPWLVRHVWDHYLFSLDRTFLKEHAYPLMKGCAEFCAGWLVADPRHPGRLTTAPSFSTENTFGDAGKARSASAGCTMDIALIREVFTNTIDAASVLGLDAGFAARLKTLMAKLPLYQIGRDGRLQEWEFDFPETEPDQRHISHLYPVYPGADITPRTTPKLAVAAKLSMLRRLEKGGASTGWSRSWAVNVLARLGDGERAHESLNALFQKFTGPTLMDLHPGADGAMFQIDGNFAGTAAIIEMLLQSHAGELALLPALPKAWSDGAIRGVRARRGLTVDLRWDGGRVRHAAITSAAATTVKLRLLAGQSVTRIESGRKLVAFEARDGLCCFQAKRGRRYTVAFV
jgi:alpha-L-fucosidase 2